MIFDEETDPKTKRAKLRPLDNVSVPELKEYLVQLAEEMKRVQAEIDKKEKHKGAVDAIFRKPG